MQGKKFWIHFAPSVMWYHIFCHIPFSPFYCLWNEQARKGEDKNDMNWINKNIYNKKSTKKNVKKWRHETTSYSHVQLADLWIYACHIFFSFKSLQLQLFFPQFPFIFKFNAFILTYFKINKFSSVLLCIISCVFVWVYVEKIMGFNAI
jgi:hypothetical protein